MSSGEVVGLTGIEGSGIEFLEWECWNRWNQVRSGVAKEWDAWI